jgi:hypothetical protein
MIDSDAAGLFAGKFEGLDHLRQGIGAGQIHVAGHRLGTAKDADAAHDLPRLVEEGFDRDAEMMAAYSHRRPPRDQLRTKVEQTLPDEIPLVIPDRFQEGAFVRRFPNIFANSRRHFGTSFPGSGENSR